MTITQMQYIIAIAEHGSFVEASKHCFVTQPALTSQVKNLEDELDVILFDRTKKPVSPTPIGQRIIDQAHEVLMQVRKIPDTIREYKKEVSGDLKLGIIPTISPYLIPLFINYYNETHDDVHISIEEEITEEIITKLKKGEIDAGIIATPIESSGLEFIPMYYEKFYGYVSRSHPLYFHSSINKKDLEEEDIWLLKEGNCFRNQVINICNQNSTPRFRNNFRFESHSIESLKRIVEVREGLTLIPQLSLPLIKKENTDMVKEIKGIEAYREVSLVVTRQFLKRGLIMRLKQSIEENLPETILKEKGGLVIQTNVVV
ncbi:MAG TPA: DNA-binding transcriptional regulator OxyR [Flavobacteriales bacterium]|jgi:LysR family hydrogen peroxide-inducible transcriptional activator|nr:DNA-binding transcriptional regulator OxyR [Flavobacteriales bacterium]